MKEFSYIFFFIIFFCFGLIVANSSRNFIMTAAMKSKNSRDPAAIKRVYDFSELQGSALDQASKQRLLSGAKIIKQNNEIGIELGHFVVKGTNGQKTFACQKYSQVILEFEGDGSASNGQKPKMEVEGSCEVSQADINTTSPLWIPVARILGEPVADGEFDFRDNHPVKIRFLNVMQEWPVAWKLVGVRLHNIEDTSDEFKIDERELQQLSRPFFVLFK